jgi:hypothetical protein
LSDEGRDNYEQVYNNDQPNEASFGHEVVGGAAAFGAMKVFEDHQRKEGSLPRFGNLSHHPPQPAYLHIGKTVNHAFAKELLAGFAGAEVDRLAETKGEDFVDRERAKHEAKKRSEELYNQHYGGYDEYNPQQQEPHGRLGDYQGYSDDRQYTRDYSNNY